MSIHKLVSVKETAEVKRLKRFDPFIYTWKFFKITKKHPLGEYLRMPGNILALATIDKRLVAWLPFDRFSPLKLGEFYSVSQEDILPLGLSAISASTADSHLAYLYIRWDSTKNANFEDVASQMLKLTVSPKFKKAPSKLYRGMVLTPEDISALKTGKQVPLKPRLLTSWSTSFQNAEVFADSGVVVEKEFKPNEIFCNLQLLDNFFKLPLAERLASENEVLVHGNGIGKVLSTKLHKLSFIGKRSKDE